MLQSSPLDYQTGPKTPTVIASTGFVMLCSLQVQVDPQGGYLLRVTGNTAVGRSGTGGRDEKHYTTAESLLSELDALGLGQDVLEAAARACSSPESRKRFVKFAENVQIPFQLLERADIYLFG